MISLVDFVGKSVCLRYFKLQFYKILQENPGKSMTSYIVMNINELVLRTAVSFECKIFDLF